MTKKTKKMAKTAKVSKKTIKQSNKKKTIKQEEEKGFNTTQLLTAGFLAFIVFSSKGIIIYNEEILVGLGFLGFVFFVSKQYGKDIRGSLELRGIGVKQKVAEGLEKTKSSQEGLRDIWTSFNLNEKDLLLPEGIVSKKDKILTQKVLGWGFTSSASSENFTSWFSQVLIGGLGGSLKSSIAHGSWDLLKGGSGGGSGQNLDSWSGTFRQRACAKAYQALESGDKAIQDKWVSMSLAGVSKMPL